MSVFRPVAALCRLFLLLALVTGPSVLGPAATALAQADRNPRDIATTNEEAGKEAYIVVDEEGSDDRSRWAHRRWERDRDSEDVGVGPIVTDNTVWVARDEGAARAIYSDQVGKQRDFPESADRHEGPFEFKIAPMGDEVSALSGCVRDRCESRGGLDLHHRVVVRRGNVVSVMYLFGRERNTTTDLTLYFVGKLLERM